ncbi:MAG: TIR domain-containing protein [Pikeienuella sp.]
MAEPNPAPDTAKVFLSYSRKDRERAQSIADVLRERHFGVFKDTDDILPTEEWKGRLEQLISEADTIVFLLSPHSLASEVCAWEVEHAKSLNKRIAPIVIDEVDTGEIPPDLSRLNFIFCTERDRFQDAIDNLISALNTDIDWVREHTRLAELARRWDAADRPTRLLLRGQDITDAEAWRDSHPEEAPLVTAAQAAFVGASRAAAVRRQRITAVSSVIGLIVALGLAGFAYVQREAAVENEALARASEQRALTAQTLAEQQRDAAQTNQSLLLTGFAEEQLKNWAPVEAALLALEAMPDQRSTAALQRARPLVDEAHVMLRKARDEIVEQQVLLALPGSSATRDARISISHDERWVVVSASRKDLIAVIDLSGKRPTRIIEEDFIVGSASALSFDDADSMVVAKGRDGHIVIIPLDEALPIRKLKVSPEFIYQAQFINGGEEVLARDEVGTIRVINSETGEVRFTAQGDVAAVSPDGQRFAIYRELRVFIHDAETKEVLGRSKSEIGESGNPVDRLIFSPTSKWLGAGTANRTYVLSGRTAKFRARTNAQDQSILAFGFGPQDDWHYVSNIAGQTDLFDINDLSLISAHKKQRGWIHDVDITDDRTALLTGSSSGWMQLWSPGDNEVMAHLGGPLGGVVQARLIGGGAGAVSYSTDGTVRLWSLTKWVGVEGPEGEETKIEGFAGEAVFTPDRSIMALTEAGVFNVETGDQIMVMGADELRPSYRRFSADGRKLLAMAGEDRGLEWSDVCLFDLDGTAPHCVFNNDAARVFEADMDDRATTIVAKEIIETDRHYITYDVATGREIGRMSFDYNSRLGPPTMSADGQSIFILDKEQVMQVYDRTLTTLLSSFGPAEGGAFVTFSPDRQRVLYFWPVQDKAEVWDTSARQRLLAFDLKHASNSPPIFSPSGDYLVSRHTGTELGIYRTSDGKLTSTIEIRSVNNWLERPVFSADEQFITADVDGKLRVWDVQTGAKIVEHKIDARGFAPIVFGKAFVDDGRALVGWTWDGPVKWDLSPDPQSVVQSVQDKTPRCLSRSQRKQFFLPAAPPRWCITGPGLEGENDPTNWQPKWPYQTDEWRDWLAAVDRGEDVALPE